MARRPRLGIQADQREKRWTPASLSTLSLALTFALFLSLLISLSLLKYGVNRGNGFVLLSRNPYTWVYGPTALLIIITSIWRQVDYHCKALRPWEELQKGPAPADRTLLLDLVSPLQVVSFFNAVTKSHFPVGVTISGFLILKLITIASTGLLDVATIGVGPIDAILQYTSQINNATIYNGYQKGLPIVSAAVPYTVYAIIDKDLPFSDGTTNELAHEIFQLMEGVGVSNLSYSTDVQAFVPKVSCDAVDFELSFKPPVHDNSWYSFFTFRNDSRWTCSGYALRARYVYAENVHKTYCPPRQLRPVFGSVDCWPTKDTSERGSERREAYESDAYLVAIVDLHYHQTWNQSVERFVFGDPAIPASAQLEIRTTNAFLCKIDYAIETRHVTYEKSTILPSISEKPREVTATRGLTGFTAMNLTAELGKSFGGLFYGQGPLDGAEMFENSLVNSNIPVEQPSYSIFRMMSSYVGGDYVTLLNDAEVMRTAAQDVIRLTSVQIAHELLFRNSTATLTGQMSYTVELLQMQSTSVYILLVGFVIMATATLIIWLIRPTLVMIDDPETIAAHANVLSHSRLLSVSLSLLRPMEEKRAQQYLKQDRYFMQRSKEDKAWFDTISPEVAAVPTANLGAPSCTWWRPFTMSSIFLVMTMSLPLVAITLLEVLQHISDRSDGFAPLRKATPLLGILAYTKFLPALVMLLIATAFNCFDFNTLVLEPFRALRSTTRGSRLLLRPPLSQLPPMALFNAVRMSRWTAFLTSVAAFIGSVLPVVVSGLYSVQDAPLTRTVPFQSEDVWNLTYDPARSARSWSASVAGILETLNVSYPDFTYDELAFPKMSLPQLNQLNFPSSLVTLRVPALRAKLDCHEVAPERVIYNVTSGSTSVSANFSLPPNCHRGSQYGNESFLVTEQELWVLPGYADGRYLGRFLDVHVGPWDAGNGTSTGVTHLDQPDNPLGCPSAAVVYGRRKSNHSDPYYSGSLCYQLVQTVETDVTLTFPGLKIPRAHPPVPDEDTVLNVTVGPNGESAFAWRLQSGFQNSFQIFNSTRTQNITFGKIFADTGDGEYDQYGFFFGILAGRTPLLQAEMLDRAKFWPHLQMFYRRYMAQTLSDNMRVPVPSSGQYGAQDFIVTTPNITGQLVAEGQLPRLVQHHKPKLALEIMLGVMFVCGVLAWTFGQQRDIVPWNPCTIAGVMVLFAGSNIGGHRSQLSQTGLPSDAAHRMHSSGAHPSPRNPSGTILIDTTPSSTNPSDTSPPDAPHSATSPLEPSQPSQPDRSDQTRVITRRPVPTTISLIQQAALPGGPASPHSIPRKPVPRPTQSEVQGAYHIVPGDETSGLDELDTTEKLKQAKFRLGWWREGFFMGKNGPPPVRNENSLIDNISEPKEQDRWRYGIDLMTDSTDRPWQSPSEGMVRLAHNSALAQNSSRAQISLPAQNSSTAQISSPAQSGNFPTPSPPPPTPISWYHHHRSDRERRGEPD
jgi:Protein of unknown function (DUF3433)